MLLLESESVKGQLNVPKRTVEDVSNHLSVAYFLISHVFDEEAILGAKTSVQELLFREPG